ncbi:MULTISPECIES: hypothetical protein [Brucella]|uniref:Uncharacterized protein n=13 Tax=Brucella TaxID=234 RepID=Q2YS21_BRUA2|nr:MULTISPECIES: hypothetical protein [Brucella]AAN30378.1 hypothetical protein BR1467 [Brucella suis 1330]AAX74790.1 hypothetical protein BruAb1_1462 [Brucella abortus bv. 1 str. 9-941]ABX62529.1 Hypothetical protein, conserved [Brucella canis ATCC 23365]ABY38553.1 Hypothetical protein, conserved [Brucella suis ATCC 23445]ACO01226.1 Hypothetical protein, conserved [Brucella melitensis ATCC 23457]
MTKADRLMPLQKGWERVAKVAKRLSDGMRVKTTIQSANLMHASWASMPGSIGFLGGIGD